MTKLDPAPPVRHQSIEPAPSRRAPLAYIRSPRPPAVRSSRKKTNSWSGQRAPFRSKTNQVVSERFVEHPFEKPARARAMPWRSSSGSSINGPSMSWPSRSTARAPQPTLAFKARAPQPALAFKARAPQPTLAFNARAPQPTLACSTKPPRVSYLYFPPNRLPSA